MLKKSLTLFVLVLFTSSLVFAQAAKQVVDKAPKPVMESLSMDKSLPGSNPVLPHSVTAVLIGKMWNAYSTQGSYTNQIFTDPFSGLISVIHRVDTTGAGSGRIVYQGSDDGGQNWTPQIGPMNLAPWNVGRHPNIVLSNPTKSTTPGEQVPVAGWAEFSSGWYWYQFARDQAFGAGTFTQYIDSTYYPGDEMFVNSQGHVFATIENIDPVVYGTDTVFYHLFVSTDQGSTWTKYPLAKYGDVDNYNGMKGFINKNGVGYIVFEAQQPGSGFYSFAYKKTTDDGATWDANWTWVNPFTLAPLAGNVHALNYEVDAIVDGAGNLHFAGTFVDTVSGANTGIYHIWGQGNTWQAEKVASVNRTSMRLPGGLRTLNEVEFATNWDGTIGILKWCDVPTAQDTLYDAFMTPVWGAPKNVQNITNTPAVHEKFSQTSAFGYMVDNTTFRVDCMYTIFGSGDTNDVAESELWYLSGVTFQLTGVNDPITSPSKFELEQNYPNPFNPTTTIRFTIPEKSQVTLKVFDMLGREVSTLVNEVKDAGTHTVKFAGKDLPSGMYLYTLTAGNYTATKKMMLVK